MRIPPSPRTLKIIAHIVGFVKFKPGHLKEYRETSAEFISEFCSRGRQMSSAKILGGHVHTCTCTY